MSAQIDGTWMMSVHTDGTCSFRKELLVWAFLGQLMLALLFLFMKLGQLLALKQKVALDRLTCLRPMTRSGLQREETRWLVSHLEAKQKAIPKEVAYEINAFVGNNDLRNSAELKHFAETRRKEACAKSWATFYDSVLLPLAKSGKRRFVHPGCFSHLMSTHFGEMLACGMGQEDWILLALDHGANVNFNSAQVIFKW
eukprot:TRINITY_DN97394_c0_g1_i1.p1 TRINITY_DN97394_c0_g1~~TRINITY_DN97394_c0_g1_i1.p1  ORF type:complete len:224 (-),score=30.58 TRINITY_DN97394_c0_g1_i1:115-708(-)